jgi:phospholipid/cholesterol/gamma-HCH transport system ATP-binding protein
MVTHDAETLAGLATHIAVLADRHIIKFGTVADVMSEDHPFLAGFRDGDRSGLL